MADAGLGRSPTFAVPSERMRGTLDTMQRREQHFSEQYQKNKPLCFNAKAYQKTHPKKAQGGQKDADATLVSPMLVGVADGVSQIEEFGIDASELPNELLDAVEELAVSQLLPDKISRPGEAYKGPINMLKNAYESTESLGSTTILLAVMDNSSKIHGKLHPMIAVLSIGDCEILILRRQEGRLEQVFHTEMQRIGGHAQSPLQLARVDDSVDPNFDESIAIEVIERGSAVHCVSAYEGDIVVLGSDGVFDNLFVEEIVQICDDMLPNPRKGGKFKPTSRNLLGDVAKRIVQECHAKTLPTTYGSYPDTPIGRGGKMDDTSCLVGEVVEWTEDHGEAWSRLREQKKWTSLMTCGGMVPTCQDDSDGEYRNRNRRAQRNYPSNPNASFSTYWGSFSEIHAGNYTSNLPFGSFSEFGGHRSFNGAGSFSEYGGSFASTSAFQRARPRRRARASRGDEDSDDDNARCAIL
jgi:protein phosphatase PTC7